MTIQDFVSLSGEILTQYYDNNITPFLDACHEDILWIGPAEKQVIRTKKVLVNTFLSEQHELKFVLHDLVITPLATTSNRVVEIIMFFMVDTIWPDNSMNRVNQRIHLSWIMNNGVPQIRLCHMLSLTMNEIPSIRCITIPNSAECRLPAYPARNVCRLRVQINLCFF